VQIATVLAGVALRLLRERRTATWIVIVALATVMVASAVAEMNLGNNFRGAVILVLVALLLPIRARKRRTEPKQLVS
jgi:hypothetical protein